MTKAEFIAKRVAHYADYHWNDGGDRSDDLDIHAAVVADIISDGVEEGISVMPKEARAAADKVIYTIDMNDDIARQERVADGTQGKYLRDQARKHHIPVDCP
jgi:hypothetical protein